MKSFPYLILSLAFASCTVGPDHQAPNVTDITPAQWKWKTATPRDDRPKGAWWSVFKDSELDRLESLAVNHNNNLRAAMARVDQATAITRTGRAAYLPDLDVSASARRERTSGNPPSPVPITIPPAYINSYNVPFQLAYEIDLWGRIRRGVESAEAETQASIADYQNVLLTLTGDVAANYFQLRAFDDELLVLRRTLETRENVIGIIEQRFEAGAVTEIDPARARSEIATTRADLANVKRQREELVSAIAVLCGRPASSFTISESASRDRVPRIPPGVPSTLLERRPDVAAAERNVAARSADIGIQTAGFFPAVSLTGQAGYLSRETRSLFDSPSQVWSISPTVALPITGLFTTKAKVERARAAHQEAISAYRDTVLNAIKDVETSLTQIHYRNEQYLAQVDAVTASDRANDLILTRYKEGEVSFLDLLDASRTSLNLQRQAVQVKALRLVSTVRLIKALGGTW